MKKTLLAIIFLIVLLAIISGLLICQAGVPGMC